MDKETDNKTHVVQLGKRRVLKHKRLYQQFVIRILKVVACAHYMENIDRDMKNAESPPRTFLKPELGQNLAKSQDFIKVTVCLASCLLCCQSDESPPVPGPNI